MANRCAVRVGTSGFSYKEWLGSFYPPKFAGSRMLEHYAQKLATVEINYTFRAMPKREMLEKWASQTPAHFRFALKAPQRITHFARLRNVEDATGHFIDVASVLGERLGPALFQLPPDFKRDVARLKDFLAVLKGRIRAAFEFRNESWFDDEVFEALADGEASLCIAETEKLKTPVRRTASHVYLRLRMGDYDDAALSSWARHVDELGKDANEIYVFFKHEDRAPELALKFRAMVKDAL